VQQLTKVNIRMITLTGVNIQLFDKVTCLSVLIGSQLTCAFACHLQLVVSISAQLLITIC